MLVYHKAISDDGGAIGDVIHSGNVGEVFPEISLSDQEAGVSIPRKFYIANDGVGDVTISSLSMNTANVFPAILFESSGDSETVNDLTGSETDESPIAVTIPSNGHKSFWIRIDVSANSTPTENYGSVDVKKII